MYQQLFRSQGYQGFLGEVLSQERGQKAALARALNTQTSYVSQVLNGSNHLSLEHALETARFLGLSSEETRYFLLMVQRDKAGSLQLKGFFESEMGPLREKLSSIKEQIQVFEELDVRDSGIYYSAWWYVAVHILVALPQYQTLPALMNRTGLPREVCEETLEFLLKTGCVVQKKGRYTIGNPRIHLDSKSPLVARHHANWRIRSIQSIDRRSSQEVHYSSVIGVSKATAEKIKAMMLKLIKDSESHIRDSKEEEAYVMLMDFFEL